MLAAAAGWIVVARRDPASATRTKGSARLAFYVSHAGAVRRGSSGEEVVPGDRVRFVAISPSDRWVVVLSRDAAGQVSVYSPDPPPYVPAGVEVPFPNAIELDATVGPESIFAVFCPTPPDLSAVRAMVARSGGLIPPQGCTVDHLVMEKRRP